MIRIDSQGLLRMNSFHELLAYHLWLLALILLLVIQG